MADKDIFNDRISPGAAAGPSRETLPERGQAIKTLFSPRVDDLSAERFLPPFYLRNAFVQTALASLKIRVSGNCPMRRASREVVLDAGDSVRLQGFISRQPGRNANGLVILLHGWEGSVKSTYILHTGRFLFSHGYDVFRLNFRDHGNTHHLNEGIFYGTLLEEVFQAASRAALLYGRGPVFLMGFSLGGNFALRIARRLLQEPVPPFCHIMAISPAVDPGKATDAIDRHPVLRGYFLKKWKRSLQKKEQLFPHLYDFSCIAGLSTNREVTEVLVRRIGTYPDADAYFSQYTLGPDFFQDVEVPVTIVSSSDDPAIPVEDFYRLNLAPETRLIIHTYGGHNGFLNGLRAPVWYETEALRIFSRTPGTGV